MVDEVADRTKSALACLNLMFDTAQENVQARLKRTTGGPDVMGFVEGVEMSEEEIVAK